MSIYHNLEQKCLESTEAQWGISDTTSVSVQMSAFGTNVLRFNGGISDTHCNDYMLDIVQMSAFETNVLGY